MSILTSLFSTLLTSCSNPEPEQESANLAETAYTYESGKSPTPTYDGYVLASKFNYTLPGGEVFMVDRKTGTSVWNFDGTEDLTSDNVVDSLLTSDGKMWVATSDMGHVDRNSGMIIEVAADKTIGQTKSAPGLSHAIEQREEENGTIISYIKSNLREDPEYGPIAYDTIVEFLPEGKLTIPFDISKLMGPSPPPGDWPSVGDTEDGALDWTHMNALHWSEPRQSYLASVGAFHMLVEFTPLEEIKAVYLGRDLEEYDYISLLQQGEYYAQKPYPIYTGAEFMWAHGATFTPDGTDICLIDNRGNDSQTAYECYNLNDDETMTLTTQLFPPDTASDDFSVVLGAVAFGAPSGSTDNLILSWGASIEYVEEINLVDGKSEQVWAMDISTEDLAVANLSVVSKELGDLFLGSYNL